MKTARATDPDHVTTTCLQELDRRPAVDGVFLGHHIGSSWKNAYAIMGATRPDDLRCLLRREIESTIRGAWSR